MLSEDHLTCAADIETILERETVEENKCEYVTMQEIYKQRTHRVVFNKIFLMLNILWSCFPNFHSVKCVQIRSFFWSVFSRVRTEYGEIRSIPPYSFRMRENTDQKNSVFGHFSRSVFLLNFSNIQG